MPNDWHHVHLTELARGGAGLVIVEATAVSPEGRITPEDLGLWNDRQAEALIPIVRSIKEAGAVPGIQIGHTGRRGSINRPWDGNNPIPLTDERGWQTIAPSAIPYDPAYPDAVPAEMSLAEIARVQADFVQAANRALEAGFEWLELHFGHGFLAQSFFSPVSNHRTDRYGGSLENRSRFILETVAAVRAIWPDRFPLTARFGLVEFDGRDEETLAESIELTRHMKQGGLDLLSVTVGWSTPSAQIPWGPAFLAPIAEKVRCEVQIPVALAWGLDDPQVAERVLRDGQADLVKVGRALLANPHWPYWAAVKLRVENPSALTLPPQYAYWLERHAPITHRNVS